MARSEHSRKNRTYKHSDLTTDIKYLKEEDLFRLLRNGKKAPLVLILDGITDPHNLGACLRSAEGAGVDAVIVPRDRSVAITDTVRKIASGGAENVPFVRVTNLARTMKDLKESGLWIVGTSDQGDRDFYKMDLTGPTAIVIGSEGKGVRRLTAENCDFLTYIPMQGKVECLNASVACGVCLFEAVRQRLAK